MKPNGPTNQRNTSPYSKCGEKAKWRNDLLPSESPADCFFNWPKLYWYTNEKTLPNLKNYFYYCFQQNNIWWNVACRLRHSICSWLRRHILFQCVGRSLLCYSHICTEPWLTGRWWGHHGSVHPSIGSSTQQSAGKDDDMENDSFNTKINFKT